VPEGEGPARASLALIQRADARIGDYVLVDKISEGGMGEVYVARHTQTGMPVALKLAKRALLATPDGLALFRNEINALSRLTHDNIARVFPSTHDDARPYFVMELFEGGTLEDRRNRELYRYPRRAVELILQIAAGIRHAHTHGVLHCDLKPANILFDAEGVPHVADFGLARIVEAVGARSPALPGGTPGWQSPEQAMGQPGSAASDVFQLGVMLHWLMHDELPQPSKATAGKLPWAPTLDCAVEDILRRALARLPEDRYQTVSEFSEDLEHALRNEPLRAETRKIARRLVRWAHRQKLLAGMLVSAATLLVTLPLVLDSFLGEARTWIRQQNRFAAQAQARAVKNQLQVDAAALEKAAVDPEVHALIGWRNLKATPPALARHQGRFDNVFLFSADGGFEARSPIPEPFGGPPNYAFRDYHRCAMAAGRAFLAFVQEPNAGVPVCASRVFRSTTDGFLKLSLGAPVIHDEKVVGVITGSIQARDRFAGLEMRCGPGQCMTALLGPRDRDDPKAPLPRTLVVLAHPLLRRPFADPAEPRDERRLDAASVERICRQLRCEADLEAPFADAESDAIIVDDLEEPVTHQRSVVALAPVGRTGLVVMVATPDAAVEQIRVSLRWAAWLFLWIPPLTGLALLSGALLGPRLLRAAVRRRQTRRT